MFTPNRYEGGRYHNLDSYHLDIIISVKSDDEDTIMTKMAKKEADIFAEIAFFDKKMLLP